jgi:hypothetical protein
MSNDAGSVDEKAANQDATNASGALGAATGDISDYMSNVNSQLAEGNPYESKAYLTQQNLATSGAMNSENDAADEKLNSEVARTGTNTAALAGDEAENAREGQRDLTNYTATRDTQNQDKWQQEQQGLDRDELAGAQEEGSLYGTAVGGQDSTLGSMTTADDAEDQMWGQMAGGIASGAGAGIGGYFSNH